LTEIELVFFSEGPVPSYFVGVHVRLQIKYVIFMLLTPQAFYGLY